MTRILPLILLVMLGNVLFSEAQIVNFKRTDLFPALAGAKQIEQGDFDGDGLIDLVVGGERGFQIIYNESRKFERIVRYEKRFPHALSTADFNNDGVSDVAVSYSFSGKDSLAIFTNDGEGAMTVTQSFACQECVGPMTSTDITGDNRTDVVMISSTTQAVYVFANTGSGFSSGVKITLPFIGRSIISGDFNDDGLKDLAILSFNGNQFVYLLGINASMPAAPIIVSMSPNSGVNLSVANLDLTDGDELLVGTSSMSRILKYTWTGSTFVFENITTGTTGFSQGTLATGNLNMDTAPDIVALDWDRDQISILYNDGTGELETPGQVIETISQPTRAITGDFDQDGRDDIALINSMSLAQILFQEANGSFTSRITGHGYGVMTAAADFNNDDSPDLAVINYNINTITILDNDHVGGFTINHHIPTGAESSYLYAKDLDGDTNIDLIASNTGDNTISIYRGKGDGTFHAAVTHATGDSPSHIAMDDFDGDADLDLIVVNSLGNSLSFFRQQGGVFVSAGSKAVDQQPGRIVSGDLNSDGKPDLLLAYDYPLLTVKYLLNTGSLTFANAVSFNAPNNSYNGTLIQDFTGDGILDVGVIEGSIYRFYKNNGNAVFTPQTGLVISFNASDVTTGDYNDDGLQDLAFSNAGLSRVEVFLRTPTHSFVKMPQFPTYSGPIDLTTADINGDERDDLIVATSPHYYLTTFISLPEIKLVADNKTREYGLPNPELTGHVEGSELSEQLLVQGYDTPAGITSNKGTYYISANPTPYALDNFSVLYQEGTFTITTAPLVVTAHNAQRIEGQSEPQFTGDIEGIRNNDQVDVSYSTNALFDSPPGEYVITPIVTSVANNYTITYRAGTLTITVMVGLEDDFVSGMGVYPNPTTGTVILENTAVIGKRFTLFTPQGSVHAQGLLQPGKTSVQLTTHGLYMLRVNGRTLKIAVK